MTEEHQELQNQQEPVLVITPEAQVLRMTNTELIEAFDPQEPDSLVAERLNKKSNGKAFLVWDEEAGNIVVKSSVECLEEIIAGYPPKATMVVNGVVFPVLCLGVRPNIWVDENPCKKNEPLHRDGRSAKGVPWGNMSKNIRQLIRVGWYHLEEGDKEVKGQEQEIYLLFRGLSIEEASQLFPKSAIKLRELTQAGEAPNLKVRLGEV